MAELDEVQSKLVDFDERIATINTEASRLEGQHSAMVKELESQQAELKLEFPKLKVVGVESEKLEKLAGECELKLAEAEQTLDDVKNKISMEEPVNGLGELEEEEANGLEELEV